MSPTQPPQTSGAPPRALVVVDSRNVVGQTARVLGEPAHPDVAGICSAIGRYGFAAEKVLVALALPRSGDRAKLQTQLRVNEAFRDRVLAHNRGAVLLGELHAREKPGGRVDSAEKMVDTGCAVEIVRHARDIADGRSDFDAIIVLSEDIDLSPAYRYADDLGVPVYAAATGVVDRRADYHRNFLLLTPDVLAEMCPPGRHGRSLRGHDLRAAIAQAYKQQSRLQLTLADDYSGPHSGPVACTEEGLLAVVADRDRPDGGQSVEMYANHLHFGDPGDPLFPYLRCEPARATGDRFHRIGTVARWKRPGVLDIRMNNDDRVSLSQVPLGHLTPGSKVVVCVKDGGHKFVGSYDEPAPVEHEGVKVDTRWPVEATFTEERKGRVRAKLDNGATAQLLTGRNVRLQRGDRVAGLVVGNAGPWLAVQAVSTPLPRP